MPVGTAGTVKAMYPDQVRDLGADIILGNTYHLMLRPGAERVARLGGLHDFVRWPHPILTDSGGFQVMSLSDLRKINEEGVTFQSHIDGSQHFMTPGTVDRDPGAAGSDIQMQLDECIALPADREGDRAGDGAFAALGRALQGRLRRPARQGRCSASSRAATIRACGVESAEGLAAMDLKGYAIGGLAVGEPQAVMFEMIETVVPSLPADRPRYLMGVGTPDDILEFRAARGRHVRLRHADAGGAPWPGFQPLRPHQPEERPPCGGSPAARSRERLPGQPRLLAAPICITSSAPANRWPVCC